eukprot:scaffold100503_cov31-Prasinocladus_malaysianus.AAC.1
MRSFRVFGPKADDSHPSFLAKGRTNPPRQASTCMRQRALRATSEIPSMSSITPWGNPGALATTTAVLRPILDSTAAAVSLRVFLSTGTVTSLRPKYDAAFMYAGWAEDPTILRTKQRHAVWMTF